MAKLKEDIKNAIKLMEEQVNSYPGRANLQHSIHDSLFSAKRNSMTILQTLEPIISHSSSNYPPSTNSQEIEKLSEEIRILKALLKSIG
ncbi:MAG TPA: hypothetical protein VJB90_01120 [Candidatus Nanoarchaeia archaeon]|nr:hypothetical protein [Candidatus Nanoarchaeia archaeon]